MLAPGAFQLIIGAAVGSLTAKTPAPVVRDTTPPVAAQIGSQMSDSSLEHLVTAPTDTPHTRRRKVVEVSDWYSRRLTVHRYVAYATIPVFALQWAAGDQLYHKSSSAPTWAKTMHRVGATSLAGMFTVNTVTGLWNLWDSRTVPEGRALRTMHALTMLTVDAGFTWAGAKLSNDAETNNNARKLHREVALSCMGLTVVSELAMKLWNH